MDGKLVGLFVVFFISFALFVFTILFNKPIAKYTRASEEYALSLTNSLVFAYPLTVKADGKTPTVVNIFLRSSKGTPVKDQRVIVSTDIGQVQEAEQMSDEKGKVSFHVVSSVAGLSNITVKANGVPLANKLSVKFE